MTPHTHGSHSTPHGGGRQPGTSRKAPAPQQPRDNNNIAPAAQYQQCRTSSRATAAEQQQQQRHWYHGTYSTTPGHQQHIARRAPRHQERSTKQRNTCSTVPAGASRPNEMSRQHATSSHMSCGPWALCGSELLYTNNTYHLTTAQAIWKTATVQPWMTVQMTLTRAQSLARHQRNTAYLQFRPPL